MSRPYLSQSQLNSFHRCGEAYRRRYFNGERIPPGIAMVRGSSVHTASKINMRQKIESHSDLKATEIVEIAVEYLESEAENIALTDDETKRGSTVVISEATDSVVDFATLHANQQAPDYQPVLVEEKVRIDVPSADRDLLGIIDLVDDKGNVVDFKTSKKKLSQADADTSIQLSVYAAAYKARTGNDPTSLILDAAVQTKTKTYRHVVTTDRGPADFGALARRMQIVTKMIAAGLFPPANPSDWCCSAKWCGFHTTCPFVQGKPQAKQGD